MAMIGRGAAVAQVKGVELHGKVAFAAWLGVHAALLDRRQQPGRRVQELGGRLLRQGAGAGGARPERDAADGLGGGRRRSRTVTTAEVRDEPGLRSRRRGRCGGDRAVSFVASSPVAPGNGLNSRKEPEITGRIGCHSTTRLRHRHWGSDSGIGPAPSRIGSLRAKALVVTINYGKTRGGADATQARSRQPAARRRSHRVRMSGSWPGFQRLIDGTVAAFGRLDIFVDNAGMETRTSTLDTTVSARVRHGHHSLIARRAPSSASSGSDRTDGCREQGRSGSVIDISSIDEDWAIVPGPDLALLRSEGRRADARRGRPGVELALHGITVVGVAPGAVHTPHRRGHAVRPEKRRPSSRARSRSVTFAEPEEIAPLVAFLGPIWRRTGRGDLHGRRRHRCKSSIRALGTDVCTVCGEAPMSMASGRRNACPLRVGDISSSRGRTGRSSRQTLHVPRASSASCPSSEPNRWTTPSIGVSAKWRREQSSRLSASARSS